MRIKFKILLLLPILFSSVGCSKNDKIVFQSSGNTYETFYNDSYFLLDNKELHQEIALASHAMALTTFNGDEDYTKRADFLRNLWRDENFENIYFNKSMTEKPGTDSIGFGVASKHISIDSNDFTLIAIAVRGGNYEAEWTSNITIGEEGPATGFDEASDNVVLGLTDFINNYQIKGHLKFWISGYSRAAITSNMTAAKILNKMNDGEYLNNEVSYTKEDIYAYCFEPPMGVQLSLDEARSSLYQGIHNFLNYNDFVPLVAPYEWGFVRYGTDHYYSDRLTDIYFDETEREKMISLYHFTYGAQNFPNYSVDDWKFFDVGERAEEYNLPRESVNPSQGRFSRALIHELALNGIQSRENYYVHIQTGMRHLFETVLGLNEDIDKIEPSAMIKIIFEYDFIKTLIMELEQNESTQFALDVEVLFLQIFGANEDNLNDLLKLYSENAFFFISLAEAFRIRKDIMTQLFYRDNAMGIAIGHMPEVSYAFLRSTDTRIMGDKATKFSDGTYNVLHIENPRSFSLIEKNIGKEVFTYKDEKMSSSHVSAEKLADGSIDIYLPKNGEYEYVGGFDSMSMSETDPFGNETPVSDGLPLQGTL